MFHHMYQLNQEQGSFTAMSHIAGTTSCFSSFCQEVVYRQIQKPAVLCQLHVRDLAPMIVSAAQTQPLSRPPEQSHLSRPMLG